MEENQNQILSEDQKGVLPDKNDKIFCERCKKRLAERNFYVYRNGKKCEICKSCLTAHIDNFNPDTFEWVLEKMDVPFIPTEWNVIRDRAFAKDPYKMNGLSVLGKYLAKMKLNQWNKYHYSDSKSLQNEIELKQEEKDKEQRREKERYEAELKVQLKEGKITPAEYKTLVSTETQNKEMPFRTGNEVTGEQVSQLYKNVGQPTSYEDALSYKNPFLEENYIAESMMVDPAADLSKEDKIYLAMKWGRLYKPAQWLALEQLYNEFMNSFDIQGAARIDTLKMICKTSLKMNEAIDMNDIDSYQKLSRVYDSMMKAAKFTQAQNKNDDGEGIDSASAIVDFVETHTGQIPKYRCDQPQDLVDTIIQDLKAYTRSLIYEDKALAQEIERYLKDKQISESMKEDKKAAKSQGLEKLELQDQDFVDYKQNKDEMREHDLAIDDELIEEEYQKRSIAVT